MKKTLSLLLFLMLISCQDVYEGKTYNQNPVDDNPPQEDLNEVFLVLQSADDFYFYDGENSTKMFENQNVVYVEERILAVDDLLCEFNEFGQQINAIRLNIIPDHVFISGNDIFTFKTISKEESQAAGGLYQEHTQIYKNSESTGHWSFNQFAIKQIIEIDNNIIIIDTAGQKHTIEGTVEPNYIYDSLLVDELNMATKTAIMIEDSGSTNIVYTENYFFTSRWQKCGDVWLSQYGLEYSLAGGLKEAETALKDFRNQTYPYYISSLPNGEQCSLWPAGERFEYSEYVSYWVDSTSGTLIRYTPSIDSYEIVTSLYAGPRDFSDGNTIIQNLDMQWIDDELYFHINNSIFCYDPNTGLVRVFSIDMKLFSW